MKLTELQREEILHLQQTDIDEIRTQCPLEERHEIEQRLQRVANYEDIIDGYPIRANEAPALIDELEWHANKFAPTRRTKFEPATRGCPKTYAAITAIVKHLQEG